VNSKEKKLLRLLYGFCARIRPLGLFSENFVACFFIRFVVFALSLDVLFTLFEEEVLIVFIFVGVFTALVLEPHPTLAVGALRLHQPAGQSPLTIFA
jgi:hypothetical protein